MSTSSSTNQNTLFRSALLIAAFKLTFMCCIIIRRGTKEVEKKEERKEGERGKRIEKMDIRQ